MYIGIDNTKIKTNILKLLTIRKAFERKTLNKFYLKWNYFSTLIKYISINKRTLKRSSSHERLFKDFKIREMKKVYLLQKYNQIEERKCPFTPAINEDNNMFSKYSDFIGNHSKTSRTCSLHKNTPNIVKDIPNFQTTRNFFNDRNNHTSGFITFRSPSSKILEQNQNFQNTSQYNFTDRAIKAIPLAHEIAPPNNTQITKSMTRNNSAIHKENLYKNKNPSKMRSCSLASFKTNNSETFSSFNTINTRTARLNKRSIYKSGSKFWDNSFNNISNTTNSEMPIYIKSNQFNRQQPGNRERTSYESSNYICSGNYISNNSGAPSYQTVEQIPTSARMPYENYNMMSHKPKKETSSKLIKKNIKENNSIQGDINYDQENIENIPLAIEQGVTIEFLNTLKNSLNKSNKYKGENIISTLQSISDSKLFDMANRYITTDNSLDKFLKNKNVNK